MEQEKDLKRQIRLDLKDVSAWNQTELLYYEINRGTYQIVFYIREVHTFT